MYISDHPTHLVYLKLQKQSYKIIYLVIQVYFYHNREISQFLVQMCLLLIDNIWKIQNME